LQKKTIMEEHRLLTGTDNEIRQEINYLSIENVVDVNSVEHVVNGLIQVWITINKNKKKQ
jgi:hypothetical protein